MTGADGGDVSVTVDADVCMGSGNCVFALPSVFRLDEEGVAVAFAPEAAEIEVIVAAARGCPTQAISVGRGPQRLYPES